MAFQTNFMISTLALLFEVLQWLPYWKKEGEKQNFGGLQKYSIIFCII